MSLNHYDGIICFGGEDWWYHNRGHFDMQMMREFSKSVPVLYINSIGMRTPSKKEGQVFIARVIRKLKSISKGYTQIRPNFSVASPFTSPALRKRKWGMKLFIQQVLRFAKKSGIQRPLLWVACPPGAEILEYLKVEGIVYQRTDRFEDFHGVDPNLIRSYDQTLKQKADLTLFCSRELYDHEAQSCQNSVFVDHGVDFERFQSAATQPSPPEDTRNLPRPLVGFIGGIDQHTFDSELFNRVVSQTKDLHYMLVGGCSLPEQWCPHPNVTHLGRKDYTEVADYMAACDALIMPWNQSDWIKACNPIKLKEYLAIGKPILSTPFPELDHYPNLIQIAENADKFAQTLYQILKSPPDPLKQRERVESETWDKKAQLVMNTLLSLNLAVSKS